MEKKKSHVIEVVMPDVSDDKTIRSTVSYRPVMHSTAYGAQVYMWMSGKHTYPRRVTFRSDTRGDVYKSGFSAKQHGAVDEEVKRRGKALFSILDVADTHCVHARMLPILPLSGKAPMPERIVSGHVHSESEEEIIYEVDDALAVYWLDEFNRWMVCPVGPLMHDVRAGAGDTIPRMVIYAAKRCDLTARGIFTIKELNGVSLDRTHCIDDLPDEDEDDWVPMPEFLS